MNINILFDLNQGPSGGGNQFLKALVKTYKNYGIYSSPENADVILFNSHQYIDKVIDMKKRYPHKLFIHRIDGPMRLYNNPKDHRDFITNTVNKYIADATIFQSEWSKKANYRLGLVPNRYETVIYNAPDETIFKTAPLTYTKGDDKVNIVAASWSSNINKGFLTYKYLDENLDFNKYNMLFVGNTPITFKNIKHIKPLPSLDLAQLLNRCDIYITASKKDPCSNSLIEALNCGLPAVALNDGGHPEILGTAGELFYNNEDVIEAIDKVSNNILYYKSNIRPKKFEDIADQYINFFQQIFLDQNSGKYCCKKLKINGVLKARLTILQWKLLMKFGVK